MLERPQPYDGVRSGRSGTAPREPGSLRRLPVKQLQAHRIHLPRLQPGFTLAELAIVLVIVAFLLGGTMAMVSSQTDQRKWNDTQSRLEAARDALLGYAIANGRLPCPANSSSAGAEVPREAAFVGHGHSTRLLRRRRRRRHLRPAAGRHRRLPAGRFAGIRPGRMGQPHSLRDFSSHHASNDLRQLHQRDQPGGKRYLGAAQRSGRMRFCDRNRGWPPRKLWRHGHEFGHQPKDRGRCPVLAGQERAGASHARTGRDNQWELDRRQRPGFHQPYTHADRRPRTASSTIRSCGYRSARCTRSSSRPACFPRRQAAPPQV